LGLLRFSFLVSGAFKYSSRSSGTISSKYGAADASGLRPKVVDKHVNGEIAIGSQTVGQVHYGLNGGLVPFLVD
jgi:hypothetical protein